VRLFETRWHAGCHCGKAQGEYDDHPLPGDRNTITSKNHGNAFNTEGGKQTRAASRMPTRSAAQMTGRLELRETLSATDGLLQHSELR
jgi:hypothetical protein